MCWPYGSPTSKPWYWTCNAMTWFEVAQQLWSETVLEVLSFTKRYGYGSFLKYAPSKLYRSRLPKNMGVSKNNGTPKLSILIGFFIINHPFWGTPIFGNIHMLTICWDWLRSIHFSMRVKFHTFWFMHCRPAGSRRNIILIVWGLSMRILSWNVP